MRSWSYCHVIVLRSSDTVLVEQFRTASWAFCTMTFCGCFVMEANDSEITATVNNCTHSVANFLQSISVKKASKSKWVMFMLDTESSSPSFRAWHRRGRCPPCRSVHAALPSPNQVSVGAGRFRYDCIYVYCTVRQHWLQGRLVHHLQSSGGPKIQAWGVTSSAMILPGASTAVMTKKGKTTAMNGGGKETDTKCSMQTANHG